MAYIATFKCDCGFEFDIHDSIRINKTTSKTPYYITPIGIKEIEIYMAENEYDDKIRNMEDINLFIQKGWIKAY